MKKKQNPSLLAVLERFDRYRDRIAEGKFLNCEELNDFRLLQGAIRNALPKNKRGEFGRAVDTLIGVAVGAALVARIKEVRNGTRTGFSTS